MLYPNDRMGFVGFYGGRIIQIRTKWRSCPSIPKKYRLIWAVVMFGLKILESEGL
jgi:hypothetical protein